MTHSDMPAEVSLATPIPTLHLFPGEREMLLDLLADRTNTLKLMALAIATLPAFLAIEIAGMFVGLFGGKQKRIRFLSSVYPYSQ